jgi:NADH-quinone oxidoreductase subunit K
MLLMFIRDAIGIVCIKFYDIVEKHMAALYKVELEVPSDSVTLPAGIESINALPATLDTDLSLSLALNFASVLFLIGIFGILRNQKNIIIIFLCVELMLFGAGLHFLFYYLFFNYALGQIYALLVLTVATAETAIGLGIITLGYRLNRSISSETFTALRG